MSRLPFEAMLALRYLRPRRTFVSIITIISVLGVLVGVAVLIVVISVMSGFDQEWRSRILGFNAHLKVLPQNGIMANYHKLAEQIKKDPDVVGVAPFVASKVLVKTQPTNGSPRFDVPMVLGIDPKLQGSVSILPTSIVRGSLDLSGNGAVIGRDFAEGMGLDVGDRIAVSGPKALEKYAQSKTNAPTEGYVPEEYVIRGIFDVGFADFNSQIVVTSVENAEELLGLGDGDVHGLQVKLKDPFEAEAVSKRLYKTLGEDLSIRTWKQLNPEIFSALAVEKNMMFFLLFFIMIVAAFGIVNCQITFVVQKTREIGILKALGAGSRQVLWIFLSQSVVVGVLGVGLGLGLALLVVHYRNEFLQFMRHVTNMPLLPASIYQVYELPASVEPFDVLVICGTAFLACILAGLFPAWKASRLQPVEALRYE
jgi:lipoprotein-releasing system permease protein